MKELWADIPGYEGRYEVSTHGRVKSLKGTPKLLTPHPDRKGYLRVVLCQHNKTRNFCVHTLVLTAFKGPPAEGEVCRHLDGDNQNNRPDNLEWGTHQENMEDGKKHGAFLKGVTHPRSKLTEDMVRDIRSSTETHRAVADRLGVSKSCVAHVRAGRVWGHLDG